MRDLEFIAGNFFSLDIPKEQNYLLKYFRTDIQLAFLRYYLVFGDYSSFVHHTGFKVKFPYLKTQERKLNRLIAAHQKAKETFNLDLLYKIESGKYRI